MRFLFYSHDGFGLGHVRRHLAIAAGLTELAPRASVLLASGADDIYRFRLPPRVEVLKLPALRKVSNGQYLSRRLPISPAEMQTLRSSLLEAAVQSFRPSVVLVDKHPFGANGEFEAALESAKRWGSLAVLGLRDILDDRSVVCSEWAEDSISQRISDYYDLVLVYGERSIFDPVAEYEFPADAAERTRFCGYVINSDECKAPSVPDWMTGKLQDRSRPLVLATAGGGEDGFSLLNTFIQAAAQAPWQAIVVAGPMMADHEFSALQHSAAEGKIGLHTFVPGLSGMFSSVDALVCMGGYNTLAEALSQGVPTVCVPRIAPRREQLIRAQALERRGLLHALRPEQLNVENLRRAVAATLSMPREKLTRQIHATMNFTGAQYTAGHLLQLARVRQAVPETVPVTLA